MKAFFRLMILTLLPLSAFAVVPGYINYQGRLLENGVPVGYPSPVSANMRISIWSASTGGTKVYEENHTGVSVDDGVYNLQIGSGTPTGAFVWNPSSLFSSATRYLELTVTIAPNPAETLSPRQALLSAPYTIQAGNSDNLGGQPSWYYGTAATDGNLQNQLNDMANALKTICENGNGIWDGSKCLPTIAAIEDKENNDFIPVKQLRKVWTESEVELECAEPHYHGYPNPQKPGEIMPVTTCKGTIIKQDPSSKGGCSFGKESEVIYYDLSKCEPFIPAPPPKD